MGVTSMSNPPNHLFGPSIGGAFTARARNVSHTARALHAHVAGGAQ